MALIESLKLVLAPPHPAGRPFIIGGAVVAVVGGLAVGGWLFWLGLIFTLFCLYFFRDPERVVPDRPVFVAPADGRVVSVMQAVPPVDLGLGPDPRWRVAIFLSVLDVHVNRSPIAGIVTRIAYRPGKFLNASLDKASDDNERNALAMRLDNGQEIAVVQIAGLIARRILCDVREGDRLRTGERFGIIRFGSRTDLYLPQGVRPLVSTGQLMIGGETVIAMLDAAEAATTKPKVASFVPAAATHAAAPAAASAAPAAVSAAPAAGSAPPAAAAVTPLPAYAPAPAPAPGPLVNPAAPDPNSPPAMPGAGVPAGEPSDVSVLSPNPGSAPAAPGAAPGPTTPPAPPLA
jgi:phosphatidylserine decarboxylase